MPDFQSQPIIDGPEAPTLLALEAREAGYKARIAELESNERAYEEIIGKKTYREVADELASARKALEELKFWNEGILAGRGNHHPRDHLNKINEALKDIQ